jgi:hypothetical protein
MPGIDIAEILAERLLRELRNGAGQLDSGRPAADEDEVAKPSALVGILANLRFLEGKENAPTDRRRILDVAAAIGLLLVLLSGIKVRRVFSGIATV